mgnify:CR=1 FL=1
MCAFHIKLSESSVNYLLYLFIYLFWHGNSSINPNKLSESGLFHHLFVWHGYVLGPYKDFDQFGLDRESCGGTWTPN